MFNTGFHDKTYILYNTTQFYLFLHILPFFTLSHTIQVIIYDTSKTTQNTFIEQTEIPG